MLWGRKANEIKMLAYKEKEQELEFNQQYPLIKILRSSHPSNNYQACTKAIYNGDIDAKLLAPCTIEKEPTVTLTIGKIK